MENQFNEAGSEQYQPGIQLSKAEFYKHPSMKKCRSEINGSAGFLYFCAVISVVYYVFTSSGLPFDVILIVGLGLGIQFGKSRVCAILITIYGVINTIIMTLNTERLSGYWILIAAICAVKATFLFQKVWKKYQKTGEFPVLEEKKKSKK